MPCMCGDTACPSCGPAQGHDLAKKAFYEKLYEMFPWLENISVGIGGDAEEKIEQLVDFVFNAGMNQQCAVEQENRMYEKLDEDEAYAELKADLSKLECELGIACLCIVCGHGTMDHAVDDRNLRECRHGGCSCGQFISP